MNQIIIKNIPERCDIGKLLDLLKTYNIPCSHCNARFKRYVRDAHGPPPSSQCIVALEADMFVDPAIQTINKMVITADGKEYQLQANRYIPNFKQLSQNSAHNIVIYNLPKLVDGGDLMEIFSQYGSILSATVKQCPDDRPNIGYVLFDDQNGATRAIENVNGKYLAKNKLLVCRFKQTEDRIQENCEVLLKSAGREEMFSPERAASQLQQIYPAIEFAPNTHVFVKNDTRPEAVNSNGAMWIFTLSSPEMARDFINSINERNYLFEGAKEACSACFKLSKGMLAKQKQINKKAKYEASGASIQVFNLDPQSENSELERFFGGYGEIREISWPKSEMRVQPDKFHVNILYRKAGEAGIALRQAPFDESRLEKRLARPGTRLRVQMYAANGRAGRNVAAEAQVEAGMEDAVWDEM